jgi:site-specific DNA-cytosine methylase
MKEKQQTHHQHYAKNVTTRKNIKYFSLFSGIGGFEKAIEQVCNNEYAHLSEKSEQEERTQGGERAANQRGLLFHSGNRTTALCVGYSEIDKYAITVAQANYPDTVQLGSVTEWERWDIDWASIDLVTGGFPCQAWSVAGKQQGDKD